MLVRMYPFALKLINCTVNLSTYLLLRVSNTNHCYFQCQIFLDNSEQCAAAVDTTIRSSSCASEVGIAVGAVIVVICLIVIVAIVIVVLCLWR